MTLRLQAVAIYLVPELAKRHRSPLEALMAIFDDALRRPRSLTPDEVLAWLREQGLSTPADSATMIREDRDGR